MRVRRQKFQRHPDGGSRKSEGGKLTAAQTVNFRSASKMTPVMPDEYIVLRSDNGVFELNVTI